MRRMLMSLTRKDVLTAIENADSLMAEKSRAVLPRQFCGFTYYEENPAEVEKIIREGSERARKEAQKVLEQVRKIVRMY